MKFLEFPMKHKYYIKRISLVIKIRAFNEPDCLHLNPWLALYSCMILDKSLNLLASFLSDDNYDSPYLRELLGGLSESIQAIYDSNASLKERNSQGHVCSAKQHRGQETSLAPKQATKIDSLCIVCLLPRWLSRCSISLQCRRHRRCRFDPWVGKIPWRKIWQPTSLFLPGKFQGQKSLAGYSPWGRKELDVTQQLNNNMMTWPTVTGSYRRVSLP